MTKQELIDSIEWISIPANDFVIFGSQKLTALSGYKISRFPITFDQYDAYCLLTGRTFTSDSEFGRGKRPVIHISWYEAKAFADFVGANLPSVAQWENACRGGKPSFTAPSESPYTHYNFANKETVPVDTFAPNLWGIYDMLGNVSEWCIDWDDEEAQTLLLSINYSGPEQGRNKIIKSGDWSDNSVSRMHPTYSCSEHPHLANNFIGFRLASPLL